MDVDIRYKLVAFVLFVSSVSLVSGQAQLAPQPEAQPTDFPYYHMPIPIIKLTENRTSEQNQLNIVDQRAFIPQHSPHVYPPRLSTARAHHPIPIIPNRPTNHITTGRQLVDLAGPIMAANEQQSQKTSNCTYDRRYLLDLDECLARKPYPIIGLPAFKNEDLVMERGAHDKYGCQFILANGLFQNYQINTYNIDSETQCLDNSRVRLNLDFNNVTLNYLWTLRCLNRANQLLDDATHNGMTNLENDDFESDLNGSKDGSQSICVGSSQNFGFSSLQLSAIDAQIDLATDIYKNWRVTNADLSMVNPATTPGRQMNVSSQKIDSITQGTNIREFVFESLDGDELNWRYLHLYKNWSRNKMHSNFLDQFRRFLWISIQNCLSEATVRLPKKPIDVFTNNNVV